MTRWPRLALCVAASLTLGATPAKDPVNPTCPLNPGWSTNPQMKFTYFEKDGWKIVKGEGRIDKDVVPRLKAVLAKHPGLDEIWLSSPGGDAARATRRGD